MKFLLILLISPVATFAASPHDLPKEREMQAFVDQVLAMTGLHNKVDVVIDASAQGCAYAATIDFKQAIGVDPKCVGPLYGKNHAYNMRAVGILSHEIGHILSGHTTDGVGSQPSSESDADEFSGWAMFRLGATLPQAQTFAASVEEKTSLTHPPRSVRLASVERGWRNAQGGKMPARAQTLPEWWSALMKEPLPWVR